MVEETAMHDNDWLLLAAFFLLVLAEPMLEKLDRIKIKYGLVE